MKPYLAIRIAIFENLKIKFDMFVIPAAVRKLFKSNEILISVYHLMRRFHLFKCSKRTSSNFSDNFECDVIEHDVTLFLLEKIILDILILTDNPRDLFCF